MGGVSEKDVDLQRPKTETCMEAKETQDGEGIEMDLGNKSILVEDKSTLNEFWEIFVEDSPFGEDVLLKQVNVHSKAVFSYAMTLMDKIREWEDGERWAGSKFAALLVDIH